VKAAPRRRTLHTPPTSIDLNSAPVHGAGRTSDISAGRMEKKEANCGPRVGSLMVEGTPKCGEHNLALKLVRVEISEDKIVTDVYGCPFPECKTELLTQQARLASQPGKQEVIDGTNGTLDTLQQRRSRANSR
jgi:hypothetical protein